LAISGQINQRDFPNGISSAEFRDGNVRGKLILHSTTSRPESSLTSYNKHRFHTLDGLRGIAAIVVLAHHIIHPFDLSTPHGSLAVDFFFCLSGFVIGYAYEQPLLSTMSFVEFAAARIIRLYPLILAGLFLGAVVFIGKAVISHQSPFTANFIVAVILEAFLVPMPPILPEAGPEITPFDPPAWSLFFELLANFLYAAFVTRLTKPVVTFLLAGGAVVVFAQAYVLDGVSGGGAWHDLSDGFGRVFFPFLCGLFLFRQWNTRPLGRPRNLASLTPIALLAVLLCPMPLSIKWLYESVAVVVVFPLIIDAAAVDTPGHRAKSYYVFLGRLSYPLYILHYPLVIRPFSHFARVNDLHGWRFWLLVAAEMLTAIGASLVMMKVDERVRAWLTQKWSLRRSTVTRPA
jgi:peptidoglycan/LPS O-acetylase OafA/YrhL